MSAPSPLPVHIAPPRYFYPLLTLCVLAFTATVWGALYCGLRLSLDGLSAQEASHLRNLIYMHFGLAQVAVIGTIVLFCIRHRRTGRYYLLVSYNERGLRLDPAGVQMPTRHVYRCTMRQLREDPEVSLPPADVPVQVYPLFMLSGESSGFKLETALTNAYARRGKQPLLLFQPVLGASPWLACAAAERVSMMRKADSGVLVVAHGSKLKETPPEPALFCRRLRELLPGLEVELGYFNGQMPDAVSVLSGMQAGHILMIPFLLTEGIHTARDLPTQEHAAACGKTIERLPTVSELLS